MIGNQPVVQKTWPWKRRFCVNQQQMHQVSCCWNSESTPSHGWKPVVRNDTGKINKRRTVCRLTGLFFPLRKATGTAAAACSSAAAPQQQQVCRSKHKSQKQRAGMHPHASSACFSLPCNSFTWKSVFAPHLFLILCIVIVAVIANNEKQCVLKGWGRSRHTERHRKRRKEQPAVEKTRVTVGVCKSSAVLQSSRGKPQRPP